MQRRPQQTQFHRDATLVREIERTAPTTSAQLWEALREFYGFNGDLLGRDLRRLEDIGRIVGEHHGPGRPIVWTLPNQEEQCQPTR